MVANKSALIREHLKKITNSHALSKSSVNKELLKYLVEQSVKGETLSEYQIAFDVFGKRHDSDKEKNVRVYMHNLRKKVKDYYSNEGVHDVIKFEIPKGSYQINFAVNQKALLKIRVQKYAPHLLISSVIILMLAIGLFFSKNKPKAAKHFIWDQLSQSSYPTLVVLGDHYFFAGESPLGNHCMMRMNNVNSEGDLKELVKKHPEIQTKVRHSNQTYINKQAPFGLYKVMMLLGGGQTEIEMMFSSEFRWENAENRNVIFIGSFKTQNIFKGVHEKIGINYRVGRSIINFLENDSVVPYQCKTDGFLSIEYPTFSHFVTDDGRQVISFMSNRDVGVMGLLNYLSQPAYLEEFESLTKSLKTSNFRAIFEVKGQGLTNFEAKLKKIEGIEANINELWPE
ncbi:MAG: helix-turn-helix domain-containing protein [Carboxylicivirga sp.]|jgi:hypothetical protein|nr:helix-turn-helix domain-containing protein [Carboxylicivirga sp.]MCT4644314.1 helix-turn-helix domain-containing protein [Carboxylicivirga sp.]